MYALCKIRGKGGVREMRQAAGLWLQSANGIREKAQFLRFSSPRPSASHCLSACHEIPFFEDL